MKNNLLKLYLPIYLLLYLGVAFVIPTYRAYRQTGVNPITFGKTDNAHDYIGFVMKWLIGMLFAAVLLFSLGEEFYAFTSPILFLENEIMQVIGLIIIHLSLIWIAIAQYQMSTSWRIGIDEQNKTELKTKGIFGLSRNPIFLGMILSVLGLFLITPNAVTFFSALTTYFIIQIQVRLEEDFLAKEHGSLYVNYRKSVKRFI